MCFIEVSGGFRRTDMAKAKKTIHRDLPHLTILEDISTLISHSHDLQETLNQIMCKGKARWTDPAITEKQS